MLRLADVISLHFYFIRKYWDEFDMYHIRLHTVTASYAGRLLLACSESYINIQYRRLMPRLLSIYADGARYRWRLYH